MKYLLISALFMGGFGCSSYYDSLRPATADPDCIQRLKPRGIDSAWFVARVDVVGKHLSGLLLVKELEDRSTRLVFTNEVGVTFFDLEFLQDGRFEVKKIIEPLNRKVVIETFRDDFSLLLGYPFKGDLKGWWNKEERYFGIANGKERTYFTTGSECDSLRSLEAGSARKLKVSITMNGGVQRRPERIIIRHHTFNMTITLNLIDKNA